MRSLEILDIITLTAALALYAHQHHRVPVVETRYAVVVRHCLAELIDVLLLTARD